MRSRESLTCHRAPSLLYKGAAPSPLRQGVPPPFWALTSPPPPIASHQNFKVPPVTPRAHCRKELDIPSSDQSNSSKKVNFSFSVSTPRYTGARPCVGGGFGGGYFFEIVRSKNQNNHYQRYVYRYVWDMFMNMEI